MDIAAADSRRSGCEPYRVLHDGSRSPKTPLSHGLCALRRQRPCSCHRAKPSGVQSFVRPAGPAYAEACRECNLPDCRFRKRKAGRTFWESESSVCFQLALACCWRTVRIVYSLESKMPGQMREQRFGFSVKPADARPLSVPVQTIERSCERIEDVDLQLEEARTILNGLQEQFLREQLAGRLEGHRPCARCSPRWYECACEGRQAQATFSPLSKEQGGDY